MFEVLTRKRAVIKANSSSMRRRSSERLQKFTPVSRLVNRARGMLGTHSRASERILSVP